MLANARSLGSKRLARCISMTAARLGGNTLVSSIVNRSPPTVDHLMSVDTAAKLMAQKHVRAIPVTKNAKVVGLFSEKDYMQKVLDSEGKWRERDIKNVPVEEVATMGSDLVVAFPEDTVEDCLEVMTKRDLTTIPVVKKDGSPLGTVTIMQLAKEFMARRQTKVLEGIQFSMYSSDETERLYDDHLPQVDIEHDPVVMHAQDRAAMKFTEASDFPEASAAQDVLDGELAEMKKKRVKKPLEYSEAPDFPEFASLDDSSIGEEQLKPKPKRPIEFSTSPDLPEFNSLDDPSITAESIKPRPPKPIEFSRAADHPEFDTLENPNVTMEQLKAKPKKKTKKPFEFSEAPDHPEFSYLEEEMTARMKPKDYTPDFVTPSPMPYLVNPIKETVTSPSNPAPTMTMPKTFRKFEHAGATTVAPPPKEEWDDHRKDLHQAIHPDEHPEKPKVPVNPIEYDTTPQEAPMHIAQPITETVDTSGNPTAMPKRLKKFEHVALKDVPTPKEKWTSPLHETIPDHPGNKKENNKNMEHAVDPTQMYDHRATSAAEAHKETSSRTNPMSMPKKVLHKLHPVSHPTQTPTP